MYYKDEADCQFAPHHGCFSTSSKNDWRLDDWSRGKKCFERKKNELKSRQVRKSYERLRYNFDAQLYDTFDYWTDLVHRDGSYCASE